MKIQYVSDIHLEFRTIEQIPKLIKNIGADILILAGDICTINIEEDFKKLLTFLSYYFIKYKYIILIAGNHEYYSLSDTPNLSQCMEMVNKRLKDLNKNYSNFIYLNCNAITLNINNKPYTFIGATLWTKIPIKDRSYIQGGMNDYEYIFVIKDGVPIKLNIEDMQKLHTKHVRFIKSAIDLCSKNNIPCVLITHHKPIADTPITEKNKLIQAYETDITSIIKKPVVIAIHGHTHKPYDKTINGVRYLSNPKGYASQHTGYRDNICVEL
jgi:predicted phosphodiesterase